MNISVCSLSFASVGLYVSPWISALDFFIFFSPFFLGFLFHHPELGTVEMCCLVVGNMTKTAI